MSELNKRFPEILLAYIADVGCEFSNSRINELSKFVSELELEIENLKTRCAAYENDLVLIEVNEMLKNKQARVQELETQLKSKDIIINNQQGRLNYYATKDLLGGKNEHG